MLGVAEQSVERPREVVLVQILAVQHAAPLVIDDGALLVHHFVVLEHVLADLEVLYCTPAYRSRASSFVPKGPNLRNLPMGD